MKELYYSILLWFSGRLLNQLIKWEFWGIANKILEYRKKQIACQMRTIVVRKKQKLTTK